MWEATLWKVSLWVALAVCAAGLGWRLVGWLRRPVGPDGRAVPAGQRLRAVLAGLGSRRVGPALWGLVRDGLFQRRLLAADPRAWTAHLLVVVGFTLLLVFHGLQRLVTEKLWPEAVATQNPWLFLRDLCGALVVLGLAGLAVRRRRRTPRPAGRRSDPLLMGLLGVIFLSGFGLQATKTLSEPVFAAMTEEWASEDAADVPELRAFWAAEFGSRFADDPYPPDAELVAAGRELHEEACASCHARNEWAFVSWPLSRALAPVAAPLARQRADTILLYVHVLACLLGLAWLPWGRLFHAVADPLSAAAAAGAGDPRPALPAPARARSAAPGVVHLRRALALDACVQCGLCDTRCSVGALAAATGNDAVLPSAKLHALQRDAMNAADPAALLRLAEGAAQCTDCRRCTDVCPVAIDLADLWAATRAALTAGGFPAPARWVKATPAADWSDRLAAASGSRAPGGNGQAAADDEAERLSGRAETFMPCVQCQTCTNVCPVVAHGGAGPDSVDLTPQKVMNLLRLGLRDLALGARMTWDCATCYQCQESCPEGIPVTDVLYELRNLAWRRLRALPQPPPAPLSGDHA
jgi:heterodisulfide reductase subunit C/nitrate reductase gamma subunit